MLTNPHLGVGRLDPTELAKFEPRFMPSKIHVKTKQAVADMNKRSVIGPGWDSDWYEQLLGDPR